MKNSKLYLSITTLVFTSILSSQVFASGQIPLQYPDKKMESFEVCKASLSQEYEQNIPKTTQISESNKQDLSSIVTGLIHKPPTLISDAIFQYEFEEYVTKTFLSESKEYWIHQYSYRRYKKICDGSILKITDTMGYTLPSYEKRVQSPE